MSPAAGDFLERILIRKRDEIARLVEPAARCGMEQALEAAPPLRDFKGALSSGPSLRVIAELKRASPSRGRLLEVYDPALLAGAYQGGGAAALSVLTDSEHFEGDLAHLRAAREATSLPVLRKDFILDPSQVEQSRAAGADAVLLIAAALPGARLGDLIGSVHRLGMEALVEVHDAAEMRRARDAGARLIGVNNRDLRTFTVDIEVSLRLASEFPPGIVKVSESGIASRRDLERLSAAGYDAFLVGEALAGAPDPAGKLREWIR